MLRDMESCLFTAAYPQTELLTAVHFTLVRSFILLTKAHEYFVRTCVHLGFYAS